MCCQFFSPVLEFSGTIMIRANYSLCTHWHILRSQIKTGVHMKPHLFSLLEDAFHSTFPNGCLGEKM